MAQCRRVSVDTSNVIYGTSIGVSPGSPEQLHTSYSTYCKQAQPYCNLLIF